MNRGGTNTTDDSILRSIGCLIDEEHALHGSHRDSTTLAACERLAALQVGLDQCGGTSSRNDARDAPPTRMPFSPL